MKILLKALSTLIVALWAVGAAAQLEVIELKGKSAEEILPVLLPLLESGGTLTGVNNQLFLKTSPHNRDEIKRVLAAIDQPARRLLITLATDRDALDQVRGAGARGEIVLGSQSGLAGQAQVWDNRSARNQRGVQRVQTIEGGRAFIQVGRAIPLPMRRVQLTPAGVVIGEEVVYRDVGSGFYVYPRLTGERVNLEIVQQAEQFGSSHGPATVSSQRLMTTVGGRLGEWIALGGSDRSSDDRRDGAFTLGTGSQRDTRSIWLRVDAID